MHFDPNAYGNPTARGKVTGVADVRYQPDIDPGWGITAPRPASEPSSLRSSTQYARNSEGRDSEPILQEYDGNDTASLHVELTDGEGKSLIRSTTALATTSVTVELPRFNRMAYGDPSSTSKRLGETTIHIPQKQSAAPPEPIVNPSCQQTEPRTSTPQPQPSFPYAAPDISVNPLMTPPSRTRTEQKQNSVPSQIGSISKARTMSQSATFNNLKEGSETPEQVIARLQMSQTREVAQRIKRQDRGEIITTTALAHLDFLRGPLSLASHEPQSNITNLTTKSQPLSDLNPNLPRIQPPVGACESTDINNPSEAKVMRKEQRRLDPKKQIPAIERLKDNGTATQQGNVIINGSYALANGSAQASNGHNMSITNPADQTVTRSTNSVTVRSEPAARMNDPPTIQSKYASQPTSTADRGSNQRRIGIDPRGGRWATAAETKAPRFTPGSNAEGSESEESQSDADSTRPMAVNGLGLLIRSRQPLIPEERLVGWDGQILPPPTDWEFRPQFYNNTPDYISGFESWLGEVAVRTMSEKSSAELSFGVIPTEQVANLDNHPDGIGFVARHTVLHPGNADRYGHRLATSIDPDCPLDYDGDAKLDLSDRDNVRYKDETVNIMINRHTTRIERIKQQAAEKARFQREADLQQQAQAKLLQEQAAAELEEAKQAAAMTSSKNIYLRPAVEVDAPAMTAILNWHIANNVRPTELAPITEDDMLDRITMSQHARLPFIVAIERTRRSAHARVRKGPCINLNHPIQNLDPDYIGVTREEPIVGWASATDWSASNYVETTTAELELYVAPDHRKSGVGRCLMDAILEATDSGYDRKSKYDFRVAPELKHEYTGGGGRDLNKLIFQVRTYNKPVSPEQEERILRASRMTAASPAPVRPVSRRMQNHNQRTPAAAVEDHGPKKDFTKAARLDDREDDYELWLKEWFESYGFEEEAHLKKMGTKHSRFVNLRYLVRETCWQPAEGRLPNFTNGY